jgi:hypothetical protein
LIDLMAAFAKVKGVEVPAELQPKSTKPTPSFAHP